MNYLDILDQVRAHVSSLFHKRKDERLIYHNQLHTEQVVKATVKIANHYQLSDHDFFIVNVAAWFHDIGYLTSCEKHEVRGAALAKEFLESKGVEPEVTSLVMNCILATQMPQHPVGLLEEIVCDADLFHLGSDDFKERNKLIRKEASAFAGREIDKHEWRLKTIILFESHHYHTDYCQDLLSAKKEMNLNELKEKLVKDNPEKEKEERADHSNQVNTVQKGEQNTEVAANQKSSGKDKKEDKKRNDRPDKGIETMFRISSGNHQRLSDMADNKAHIMISTNSIILSVILSILLRKLEDNPHLIIPTLILLIICVVTMVFSILATRPTVPPGTFTPEDIHEKKVNLLFFGNFYRMALPDYVEGMQKMMEDRDFLYGSLIRDLYSQGVVLGRKYRLLRIAYNVFMFGIIASVLAFLVASALVTL
ncbi:HD domain-containing protein [Pedobacter sp. PAMC26386]|nr:HD domain-containing protein [Pedobacter sp. PAMC26386]